MLQTMDGAVVEEIGAVFEVDGVALVDNGENIRVNAENRDDYVHRYVRHVFIDSVRAQIEAFRRGFRRAAPTTSLSVRIY